MTSFVQPLDAGIIRCFKAHYRRGFCLRAIEKDEAGEREIYKIDLLEGMLLARAAWRQINASTIKNCWKHTKIQGFVSDLLIAKYNCSLSCREVSNHNASSPSPRSDHGAWEIIRNFATSSMTLPTAEEQLKKHLGAQYNVRDWQPALDAVMNAEGDIVKAQEALEKLSSTTQLPRLMIRLPPLHLRHNHSEPQIIQAENDLKDSVDELVKRKRIIGPPPTVEDLVNPIEEQEVGDSQYRFEGGDAEIVAEVLHEMAVARGETIELDDSDYSDDEDKDCIPRCEVINLCALLERACIRYGGLDSSLELQHHLCRYRAELQREDLLSCTQSSLDSYFTVVDNAE